ncbi:MAG: PEGA domain-containing protein, partial [Deltaproteobacteria bacterium]|nr:PEGA domain-containing protein [Deltaproteobacteria bacterium]
LAHNVEDRFQNAGDFQVELTKFLYAIYLDFSPRKLSSFITEIFHEEMSEESRKAAQVVAREQQTASINVNEGAKQIEIVHGETPIPTQPSIPTRKTAKTATAIRAGESVTDSGTARERTRRSRWPMTLTALLLLGAGAYAGFRFVPELRFWEKAPETVTKEVTPPPKPAEPPPAPEGAGVINIISDPAGAAILVNGRITGLSTPATVEKLPLNEEITIALSKPDYNDFEQTLILKDTSPQRILTRLVPLRAETGAISVTSTPGGASVLIDGKETGQTTPTTIPNIEVGKKLKMTLALKGYEEFSREVTLAEAKTVPFDAALTVIPPPPKKEETKPPPAKPVETAKPKPEPKKPEAKPTPPTTPPPTETVVTGGSGTIKLASNPSGADVFINAEYRGTTPLTVTVPSGAVSVLVNKEGKSRYSTKVNLRPGETVNLTNIALGELFGEVSITTTPPRATVVFDGQTIPAKTPVTIRRVRTDQQHSLSITLDGFRPWARSFSMEGQTQKSFNVVLEQ